MPRTVICVPSLLTRWIETPVILCSASARFWSGNLPISSAVIASTTPVEVRLRFIELIRLLRIPVVTKKPFRVRNLLIP